MNRTPVTRHLSRAAPPPRHGPSREPLRPPRRPHFARNGPSPTIARRRLEQLALLLEETGRPAEAAAARNIADLVMP